jgi:hypothetical protein
VCQPCMTLFSYTQVSDMVVASTCQVPDQCLVVATQAFAGQMTADFGVRAQVATCPCDQETCGASSNDGSSDDSTPASDDSPAPPSGDQPEETSAPDGNTDDTSSGSDDGGDSEEGEGDGEGTRHRRLLWGLQRR